MTAQAASLIDKGYKLGPRRGFDRPIEFGTDETAPKFAHHERCIAALEAQGGYLSLSERLTRTGHVVSLPLVRLGLVSAPAPQEPPVRLLEVRWPPALAVCRPEPVGEQAVLGVPLIVRKIILDVADEHAISTVELLGASRKRRVAHPRQEVMLRLYQLKRFSLPQIGGFLGGLDHTTVLHGVKAAAKRESEAEIQATREAAE